MNEHDFTHCALQSMFDEGWITEILYEVKSGKEATVHCCRGGTLAAESIGHADPLIAAKIHRDHTTRRFKNDSIYQAGRAQFARPTRVQRAIVNGSSFGRDAHAALWLEHEWSLMRELAGRGLDVPRPLTVNDRAILMPFIGDENGPAPMLHHLSLPPAEVAAVIDRVLGNIEAMLDLHCVHSDLSPYNILYHEGRIHIIDFPQAIDPRRNPAALALLMRDIQHICQWAARAGVNRNAGAITTDLWQRFILGELG
jgi:RIO kinase 1